MDDPTRPWLLEIEDPDAWLRDVRRFHAEKRAQFGMDWKPTEESREEYRRSRGLVPHPPFPREWFESLE